MQTTVHTPTTKIKYFSLSNMPAITQSTSMESVALPPSALWDPQVVSYGLKQMWQNLLNNVTNTATTAWSQLALLNTCSAHGMGKKDGRAGKFSLWVAQYLFLWPSWLCAASWWEVPCRAPSSNTTQDCLAHMSVQVAGRTHRFESSRSLDCKSREDVSLNVSAVVWARCQFFWDVTMCHYMPWNVGN